MGKTIFGDDIAIYKGQREQNLSKNVLNVHMLHIVLGEKCHIQFQSDKPSLEMWYFLMAMGNIDWEKGYLKYTFLVSFKYKKILLKCNLDITICPFGTSYAA